ncbi:MAG: ADP-ribosylglycohydrolase family protein [Methanosphaera sp.]|nr:ADP-ribosylglycohydrolase family protein [Methanosphaera sp.]
MIKDDIYASIFGGVVGDALGVPYEFYSKEELDENPISKMDGYGTYNQPPGTWSDDTSLTISLMDSLASKECVDYHDIMNKFSAWYYDSFYTPLGHTFDVGRTTQAAITRYQDGVDPIDCGGRDGHDNGNGSLMRIIPLCFYLYANDTSMADSIETINNVSALTHGHRISTASCNIFNFIVDEILSSYNDSFTSIIDNAINTSSTYYNNELYSPFDRIFSGNLFDLPLESIGSTGYVVNSLEVAIYCCYHTSCFEDALLMALNLGGDTDTNGKITGDLAGLYYGFDSIPKEWLDNLINKEYIESICDNFIFTLNL